MRGKLYVTGVPLNQASKAIIEGSPGEVGVADWVLDGRLREDVNS